MPNQIMKEFKEFYAQLKKLRTDVKSQNAERISKRRIYGKAEDLGTTWFSKYVDFLTEQTISADTITRYSQGFSRLVKLSSPNNLKRSYQRVLNEICRSFRNDLILPLLQKPTSTFKLSQLNVILKDLPSPGQNEYLQEAIACAQRRYFKAAAVLGWCAAIDQIHKVIERVGFAKFNIASSAMASQKTGRFKKFNQAQNISSIGELREVFDTTILWILEGMQHIDSNEHTRLKGCFDLRCQCAHPGNAPVTEYNLMSFFSDLNTIIFRNSKFAVDS